MAHKNISQIVRLIRSISSDDFHVFVHLDSKMSLTDLEIKSIQDCSDNVFLSSRRISGSLDSRSLVEIVFSLIECAKENEIECDVHYSYFALLSGQDYPIKEKEFIADYLKRNYPTPLIDCTPYDESNWVYNKFNLVQFVSLDRYINAKMKRGILRKLIKLPLVITSKILSKGKTAWYKHFSSYGYGLYGGSAWWILPDQVISFILDEVKSNSKKIQKLKTTYTPEETFFQIMTMASPLSESVVVNPIDMVAQNCMTYAHFSDEGKPFMGHPYILTKDDYPKLKSMPQLFARKFDMEVDEDIFNLIDAKK